jgi:hypothetical protein
VAINEAYQTPPFHIRTFLVHKKLHGHKDYKTWKKYFELDLGALNPLPFIQSEIGNHLT